jgi:YVTN family beta-propeller protein
VSGVDGVVLVESTGIVYARIDVGRRPTALLASPSGQTLVALNTLSDSLSLIDPAQRRVTATISLGESPQLSAAERGERLFYSAKLSYEGWMSCHSCHTRGHTNGQLADNLSDGDYGTPKRVLTLLGTRDTDRWAWNGGVQNLHDQVRNSINITQHGQATADEVFDLTAFLHTLEPPPPPQPKIADARDEAQLARGEQFFTALRCGRCHVPPLTYTSQEAYDVDLADERGRTKFNPPSLRGVGQGTSFLHDGRAASLEDVFDLHGHQLDDALTAEELTALVRFLRSL